MKCQILFPEKNDKNISKCRLWKFLSRMLSVKCVIYNKTGKRSCFPNSFQNRALWEVRNKHGPLKEEGSAFKGDNSIKIVFCSLLKRRLL